MSIRKCFALTMVLLSARLATAANTTVTVSSLSDPWFAGMPAGTTSAGDTVPAESPAQVTGFPIIPGHTLTFQATGLVSHGPDLTYTPLVGPDGGPDLKIQPN